MKIVLSLALAVFFLSSAAFAQQAKMTRQEARDQAIELYQTSNFKEAIPLFEGVLIADKIDWEIWYYLGMSFAKTGQAKDSVAAIRRGREFRPKKPEISEENIKILSKPRAEYTDHSLSGVVVLAVEFGADGKIGTIIPAQTLPGGLTASAVDAAKHIKFKPMHKDGKAMTVIRIIEYSFTTY